jgi:hypothetical protein
VPAYTVPAITPVAPGTATTAFTIGGAATSARFLSNSTALFDVQITQQPTGQFCIVGATGVTVAVTAGGTPYPAGAQLTIGAGAQLATRNLPLTNNILNSLIYSWTTYTDLANLAVRCRALPGTAANPSAVLTGTYQLTTTVGTVTATTNTTVTTRTRNFLTFFDDGSYIYATRSGGSTGVITFTTLTDTNNSFATNAVPLTATQVGISALPSLSLTSVAKIPGSVSRITAFAGTVVSGTTTTTTNWQLDEPSSVAGEMEGTWATTDHRRVFIYNGSTTFGSHVGTVGPAVNYGDACYFLYQTDSVPNYHTASGYYARRGTSANNTGSTSGGSEASTGCPIGSTTPTTAAATLDYYQPLLIERLLLEFPWRLPGSQSGFDGRSPSPSYFTVVPGTAGAPDQITITASNQGVQIPATTVTFVRTRSN